MANDKNGKRATAAHACSCGTSIVCMAQMGTLSAVGATGGMGAMGAAGAATALSTPFITLAFQSIGLGFLLVLPPLFYQAFLIAILAVTTLSSYFSYRFHERLAPFGLAVFSSFLVYDSIYLLVYEPLYWTGFALMFISGAWNYVVTRRVPRTQDRLRTSAQVRSMSRGRPSSSLAE